jgi:hypothetical protein
MLTGHAERSRVVEAMRLGVTSSCSSPYRLGAAGAFGFDAREAAQDGNYYGPEPRHPSSYKPDADLALGEIVFI